MGLEQLKNLVVQFLGFDNEVKTQVVKATEGEQLFPEEEPVKEEEAKEPISPSLSEEEIQEYAHQLKEAMKGFGTDEDTVKDIILGGTLNSCDLMKLMKAYAKEEHSTTGRGFLGLEIKNEFSGKLRDQLLEKLIEACLDTMAHGEDIFSMEAENVINDPGFEKIIKEKYTSKEEKGTDGAQIRTSTMMTGIRG